MRLNRNTETFEEVVKFLHEKTIQLYLDGFLITNIEKVSNLGVVATYFRDNKEYHIFYLYPSKRGKGIYERVVKEYNWTILVGVGSDLLQYVIKKRLKFRVVLNFTETREYKIIEDYYKDKYHSNGVSFMKHIDEGLAIMKWMGTSESAKKSFCLHPIYQSEKSIKDFGIKDLSDNKLKLDSNIITNVLEFRRIDNLYTNDMRISSPGDIKISTLDEVNQMLIADKIQNRKEFENYYDGNEDFSMYLINWFRKLDINENMYRDYKSRLDINSQLILN